MLQKARVVVVDAAHAVKKTMMIAKLNADILIARQKIKSLKRNFGVEVWQYLLNTDEAGTRRYFAAYQDKVKALEADIRVAENKILTLQS